MTRTTPAISASEDPEEYSMDETANSDTIYFSLREMGLILVLSVLAALSGALVPSWLFPEGRISGFVYNTLGLPGPGAGVLVFGSILCFWLLMGLILVKKPGTAVAMAVAIIAFDLLFGNQVVVLQTMDVLLFVALIIEAVCLLQVDRGPWNYILPACLAGPGLFTLAVALLGQAKQGESDLAAAQFPVIYYIFGILGLSAALICYSHPVKYLLAAGIANMYYLLHFWLFWGDGFASRFPPDFLMIPVLFLVALLGGVLFASVAYGIDLILKTYCGSESPAKGDQ
jgi:hypothetical protein